MMDMRYHRRAIRLEKMRNKGQATPRNVANLMAQSTRKKKKNSTSTLASSARRRRPRAPFGADPQSPRRRGRRPFVLLLLLPRSGPLRPRPWSLRRGLQALGGRCRPRKAPRGGGGSRGGEGGGRGGGCRRRTLALFLFLSSSPPGPARQPRPMLAPRGPSPPLPPRGARPRARVRLGATLARRGKGEEGGDRKRRRKARRRPGLCDSLRLQRRGLEDLHGSQRRRQLQGRRIRGRRKTFLSVLCRRLESAAGGARVRRRALLFFFSFFFFFLSSFFFSFGLRPHPRRRGHLQPRILRAARGRDSGPPRPAAGQGRGPRRGEEALLRRRRERRRLCRGRDSRGQAARGEGGGGRGPAAEGRAAADAGCLREGEKKREREE